MIFLITLMTLLAACTAYQYFVVCNRPSPVTAIHKAIPENHVTNTISITEKTSLCLSSFYRY